MRITLLINNQDYNTSAPPESSIKLCVTYMPLGDKGVPGKSAYQYAVDAGYIGTEEEFTEMLLSIKDKQDKIEIGNPKVSLIDLYNIGKL